MSKRFTETDKWKDAWFRKLRPYEKLLFLYILDNCDNAGFLELDRFLASYQIGITEGEVQGAYKGLERAIEGASDGSDWVWVRNFLKHQKNEELNEKNPAHRQIISLIKAQNGRGFEGASKALVSPYGIGIGNGIGIGIKEESMRGDDAVGFIAPSESDVIKYFAEKNHPESEAIKFFAYHESKGWVVGKTKMKSWKHAVTTWMSNKSDFTPKQPAPPAYQQHIYRPLKPLV